MNADALRALQTPLKSLYKEKPENARLTLTARGELDARAVACHVDTWGGAVKAGLHPATGGTGLDACSGNMLLEALVACAGVTLKAVATALDVTLTRAEVRAEGELDFRGTLGVAKDAPAGFTAIRLIFTLESDAPTERLDTLIRLTERYCVVAQTLARAVPVVVTVESGR